MSEDKNRQLFISLIYSFQMQTMMQLGKLANPVTGKIEKELDGAQVTIDMLDMLRIKTKGNITDEESRLMDQLIADLKLNYVEERDKDSKTPADTDKAEENNPGSDATVAPDDSKEEKKDDSK